MSKAALRISQPLASIHLSKGQIRQSADWLIVASGDRPEVGEGVLGVDSREPDVLAARIQQAITEQPAVLSVLIVTDRGDDYARLTKLESSVNAMVYYLQGGWQAWEDWRQLQARAAAGHSAQPLYVSSQVPDRRGGCGGCPR